jgi:hypothetical protein
VRKSGIIRLVIQNVNVAVIFSNAPFLFMI